MRALCWSTCQEISQWLPVGGLSILIAFCPDVVSIVSTVNKAVLHPVPLAVVLLPRHYTALSGCEHAVALEGSMMKMTVWS